MGNTTLQQHLGSSDIHNGSLWKNWKFLYDPMRSFQILDYINFLILQTDLCFLEYLKNSIAVIGHHLSAAIVHFRCTYRETKNFLCRNVVYHIANKEQSTPH